MDLNGQFGHIESKSSTNSPLALFGSWHKWKTRNFSLVKILFLMGREIKWAIWTYSILTFYQQSFGIIWQLHRINQHQFVKNCQNFCSILCRCDVCVTADYAASNCTEFTIVGGRVLYITSFKFVQKIDKQSKIILKIPNLTVPCCHSEVNIDDTAWWGTQLGVAR